ncbi:MAG: type IV toxin-antitoxin system AbiEi family antitoxin domain-containing protein [Myxococcota bacterium]
MPQPDRTALFSTASSQEGYFTTEQAVEAGYSRPLLDHHLHSGRFRRVRRGVYRLVEFPSGEHEDLVVAWLWSGRTGVFSHETALALHGLSDALPARHHLTVPSSWARRRLRVPEGLRLHFADVGGAETTWVGPVPVTVAGRTLRDCVADHVSPDLVAQAVRDGLARGLFTTDDVPAGAG